MAEEPDDFAPSPEPKAPNNQKDPGDWEEPGDWEDPNAAPKKSWSEVASGAASNFAPSAGKFLGDTYQAIRHPIDTGKAAGKAFIGALQNTGLVAADEQDYRPYADAVGQHFKENYGSAEGFKNALATDPVGVLGDLSMVLSGGGTAAARLPGVAGDIAAATARVGHYTNPLTPIVGAAKGVGTVGSEVLGVHAGVPGEAIRTAAGAGYEGGDVAKDFRDHLRGKAPFDDVVDDAEKSKKNIADTLSREYGAGYSKIDDTKPLSFADIDNAFANAGNVRQFKGVSLSNSTQDFRNKLGDILTDWRNLDPAQYHTALGLDALKKKVWEDSLSKAEPGSPEAKIGGEVYNSIKQTIMKQNPEYGKLMQNYEQGQNLLDELDRTLSLKDSATTDTTLRKLQSLMRNNVNTNYGYRRSLADYIMQNGSPTLIQKLAGQALNSSTPRGLGKFGMQVAGELGLLTGGAFYAHPAFAAMAPMIAMASPRVAGEVSYYGGRAVAPLKYLPPGTTTAGRAINAAMPPDAQNVASPNAQPPQPVSAPVRVQNGWRYQAQPDGSWKAIGRVQ